MDHKQALAGLDPDLRDRLQQRSDAAGLRHLAGHLAALAVTSAWIAAEAPLWGAILFPQGVLLVFLFALAHECSHGTPFRTPWLNEAVGHAAGLPLVLPFTWFRYFHLAHHKHTNDPARDPELGDGPRPNDWRSLLIYLSGWRYWRGMMRTLLGNARGRITARYLPARQHPAMRREARILIGLYALILASLAVSPLALWLWIAPVLLGQPVLRLFLLAEHGRCPAVANMLENSRTTFTNRLVRALAWNMPYHAEHHSLPNVPFHRLPALHAELRPHLRTTADGYARFGRDYASGLGAGGA